MKKTRQLSGGSISRLINTAIAALLAFAYLATPTAAEEQTRDEIKQTEELIAHSWQIQKKLRNDPYRPTYHFMPRMAWMNDTGEIGHCRFC